MADEEEVEIRGVKRPLVEDYSDDDEEEEVKRKEGKLEIKQVLIWVVIKEYLCN